MKRLTEFRPIICDHFGRKLPIILGCAIMILGAFLGAFTDGYGSTFEPCAAGAILTC